MKEVELDHDVLLEINDDGFNFHTAIDNIHFEPSMTNDVVKLLNDIGSSNGSLTSPNEIKIEQVSMGTFELSKSDSSPIELSDMDLFIVSEQLSHFFG